MESISLKMTNFQLQGHLVSLLYIIGKKKSDILVHYGSLF